MRSLFEEFKNLWPESSHAAIKNILGSVSFLYYPGDVSKIKYITKKQSVIIVVSSATLSEVIVLLNMGFEQIIQNNRIDFAQEILVSGLMAGRPAAFTNNPIPFFFGGFLEPKFAESSEKNFISTIESYSDKTKTIDRLEEFVQKNKKILRMRDLLMQISDELISNAISSEFANNSIAPNITSLKDKTELSKPIKFFCCYNEYRIIVGCEDRHGTFQKASFLKFLRNVFVTNMIRTNTDQTRGAGLGFKYIIENSSNIYLHTDENVSSLVACGLTLKGIKHNISESKNFHFSFM